MTVHPAKTWTRSLLAAALSVGLVGPGTWAADAPSAGKPTVDKAAADAKTSSPKAATTGKALDDAAAAKDPTDAAIRRAVEFLYKTQKNDNWETSPKRQDDAAAQVTGAQWGGLTAMATYALLAAGESPQHPQVAKAIAWLNKAEVIGTYAMGMKLQIWNYIERPTPQQKEVLKNDATRLLGAVKVGGGKAGNLGLYHYWLDPNKGDYDHSTSNYGVLGMWAAAQQNLEVPIRFWEVVDQAWRKNQNANGGWAYHKAPQDNHPVNMSMTSAGVATLFITQDMLSEGRAGECNGGNPVDQNLEAGLKWLSENYSKSLAAGLNLYAMYNIERVGTASGYKYFDKVDWYKDGAARLLKAQQKDGSWAGGYGGIPSTTWAILFLVKGRAPVMMNKLEYTLGQKATVAANWNQRPRDVANLARWAGHQLEKELNWQIVNLKVGVDDLHDSPILYIAGNQLLNFTPQEREKLKQFVEQGGLILGHADCNDGKFTTSFTKLGQELFGKSYDWRDLPPDHLVYNAHFKPGPNKPRLIGLSNGARELMLLIPVGDPARFWQIKSFKGPQPQALAELATNIYLYALDKTELKDRYKGQSWLVRRDETVPTAAAVKVARLDYGGNWDPEPAGWRRLASLLHNERGIAVTTEAVTLGGGKLSSGGYKLAHLTGTQKFKLNDAQRKEIRAFVEGGGTLLVDAAGGAGEFKDAAQAELGQLFPGADKSLANPLPAEHRVYSVGGDKVTAVTYRAHARKSLVGGLNRPRLRGHEVDGRTAVIYSPEDLSVGMVGMSIDGIYGYSPDDATELAQNVVLLSMGTAPPRIAAAKPASQPAAKPSAAGGDKPKDKDKDNKGGDGKKPAEKPKTAQK